MEIEDNAGSTSHYSGTVGTTPTTIPAVSNKVISSFWIENNANLNTPNKLLEFSCDGGTSYTQLHIGESMIWSPKGYINQIYIRGNVAAVAYRSIVNYEDY